MITTSKILKKYKKINYEHIISQTSLYEFIYHPLEIFTL